jgi:predicted MFS family arabinose efflux permease
MVGLAVVTLIVSGALWVFVKDPPKTLHDGPQGSVLDLPKIKALWFILPMMLVNYAPAAGIRGLWIGPYGADIFGADTQLIGTMTLMMGLAMIAGSFIYGPLERAVGSRKWVVFGGSLIGALTCFTLYATTPSLWTATAMLALIGLTGAAFPVLIAHARPFFPDHLTGRGVTLLNLFGIGGVGIFQFATGRIATSYDADPTLAYPMIFLTYGIAICCGLAIYAFSSDPAD